MTKEKQVLESADLGKFYKFINSNLSSKSGLGPLKNDKGGYVFSAAEKSELLNNYFGCICTKMICTFRYSVLKYVLKNYWKL